MKTEYLGLRIQRESFDVLQVLLLGFSFDLLVYVIGFGEFEALS